MGWFCSFHSPFNTSAYYLRRIIKCWDTTLIATCSHMLQVPLARRQGTLGQKVKWQQKEKGDGRLVRKDLLIAKCHPHNKKNGLKIYSISSQSIQGGTPILPGWCRHKQHCSWSFGGKRTLLKHKLLQICCDWKALSKENVSATWCDYPRFRG